MNLRIPLSLFASALLLALPTQRVHAQGCTNSTQYPDNTVTPDPFGAITDISTCSFQEEYSVIGPVVSGASYVIACSGGSYITVHEGSLSGPVIAMGYSSVTATATASDNLYANWTVDSLCNTGSGDCEVTTVQLMLDCTPPTATVTSVDDCANNAFTVHVDLTSLGDGTSVDIVYNVNNGGDQTLAAQPVGSYDFGPFTVGDVVNLTLVHSSNPLCNVHFNDLHSGTCPVLINCGNASPEYTFCYHDNMDSTMVYQGTSTFPIALSFNGGQMESCCDNVTIYDGLTATGTPLYTGNNAGASMAGIFVVSTNADHALTMVFHSDFSNNCGNEGYPQLDWTVGCLDCMQPVATFNVVTDCANFNYSVDVHITTLGTDPTLDFTANSDPTVLLTATDTGMYTAGPFTANIPVTINLVNSSNSLCSVHSASLVNPLCPEIIQCGTPAVEETYCYMNNDTHAWHWQASNSTDHLSLLFLAGTIQASFGTFGDNLRIYDGPDNTGALLFQQTSTNTFNLADLQVTSTGQDLYMEMTSDGFGSCTDNSVTPWDWIVGCADCTVPQATYAVVTDCDNFQFSVNVHITAIGSDPVIDLTNTGGLTPIAVSDTGMYTVGPFTANTPVVIALVNDVNALCTIHSAPLVNPICPVPIVCGGTGSEYTFCYHDNMDSTMVYQGNGTYPIALSFNGGQMESCCDHVTIYDGLTATGTPLYTGNNGGASMAGIFVVSTNSDHALTMVFHSDISVNCGSSNWPQLDWTVGCLDCLPPQATYTVVTDCDSMQFHVQVAISSLGTDPVIDITNDGGLPPMAASDTGTYSVGPFAAGSTTTISLINDVNSLCSVHSGVLTNPLCPTIVQCGGNSLEETYCYTNSDNHAWHWQSSANQPLALNFLAGTIEASYYDSLRIYDGPDDQSPLLYQHVLTSMEDLTGLLVISTGHDIYMEMSSDFTGSCSDAEQTEWDWQVGCLDCTNPSASFTVVPDCLHRSYKVAVNVDSTGSSSTVRIANSTVQDTLQNIGVGTTLVGPIPMDSAAVITVLNATNNLCRIFSPVLNDSSISCAIPSCAAEAYEYCYANADTAWFTYYSTEAVPLTIQFLWGTLLADDYVEIFDGTSAQAPLLWQGNQGGDMTGFAINSTNAENTLTMRVVSDAFGSCATGQTTLPLHWVIQCGAVGIGELAAGDFSMYPNPTNSLLYLRLPIDVKGAADLRIMDLSGRIVRHETFTPAASNVNSFDLNGLQSGNYTVVVTTANWVKAQQLQVIH